MNIPLHHNSRNDRPWTTRSSELIELWTSMAAMNPDGFRQFRTGKHKNGCRSSYKTRLERVSDLDAKLA